MASEFEIKIVIDLNRRNLRLYSMLKRLILTILFLASQSLFLTAQENDLEQDKQALRNLKDIYERAMASGDLAPLKPLLADNFSAIMITGETVNSYTELDKFWKKALSYLGEDVRYTVKIDPNDSLFIGDIALSSGKSTDKVSGSTDLTFTTNWSSVAKKQTDGNWKLLRIQVTTHPIENPFSKEFHKWKTILYTGIAALIALVVGFMFGKKKRCKH